MTNSILPKDFLTHYWQKKPLVIRQALPGFQSPVSADELAGLALDEQVESRLVIEHGDSPWQLKNGPFTGEDFANLPPNHWTLLVQAVDHWVPEVKALLQHVDQIPRWRLDDIMISYAPEGGSVGPHYDQYDVFLLQGQGRRRWQVGPICDDNSPCLPDTKLRILADFVALDEYVLEPGDILYLPPGYAHWGVALDECQTISIGFRAPSHADVVAEFGQFVSEQLPDSLRYSDPNLEPAANPGLIGTDAIARTREIMQSLLTDENLGRWLGRYMTEPKYLDQAPATLCMDFPAIRQAVKQGLPLVTALASRFAYIPGWLFVDSREYAISDELTAFAQHLASGFDELDADFLLQEAREKPQALQILVDLVNQGALQLLEDELDDDYEKDEQDDQEDEL